ncbi:YbjQ family protein [Paraburkholderia phymatum]|uniref:YbjQ family protein n=1 Tax=Paraburkholderia phymatum TaxID=148447 RepID=A0ACC6U1C4_9BURK
MIERNMVSTTFDLPGYTVDGSLGIVRGIIVRSRSVVGAIGAGLQTIFGGNISLYTSLCERARRDAYERMVAEAETLGANAVIGMRYDATEIGSGVTEVLCYGTAVRVRRNV